MKHKKYFVFQNFISDDECLELSQWILKEYSSPFFIKTNHPGTIRKTTRYSLNMMYPEAAYSIQQRIKKQIQAIFSTDVIFRTDFKYGMYASYGTEGDECSIHIDGALNENYITYHFNIILSDHKGGDVVVEDKVVKLNKRDGILYPVSELQHSTTRLVGETPRLFWCFGFCVSK